MPSDSWNGRRRGRLFAIAIVVIALIGAAFALSNSTEPADNVANATTTERPPTSVATTLAPVVASTTVPPASSTTRAPRQMRIPVDGSPVPFVPAVVTTGDTTVMPLVFPDGISIEVGWPLDLDFAVTGARPMTWARSAEHRSVPGFSSELFIRHGDKASVLEVLGKGRVIEEYVLDDGTTVVYWREGRARGLNALAFEFDGWTVMALEAKTARPRFMGETARGVWSTNLLGRVDSQGFLRLDAGDLMFVAGGNSVRMHIFTPDGSIDLWPLDCEPGRFVTKIKEKNDHAAWCTEHGDMRVTARGPASFATLVFESLTFSPVGGTL